jgi:hypothetical protein
MTNFLGKIQNQPKHIRKIIFWVIVISLGITFFLTWIYLLKARLEGAKGENFFENFSPSQTNQEWQNIPKIETPTLPDISEEEWNKLEEEYQRELEKNPQQ